MGTSRRLWNVAHRGASAERPENTPPPSSSRSTSAPTWSSATSAAPPTAPLLILHDAEVDRTTSGSGRAARHDGRRGAPALDAGDGAGASRRWPTCCDLAAGRVRVNVDLKEADIVDAAVAQAVREAGAEGSVTYISFLPEVWQQLDELTPESPRHPPGRLRRRARQHRHGRRGEPVRRRRRRRALRASSTRAMVERMHRHGFAVFAWTVDDQDEMRRLIACDVNGIVTNRPAALAEVSRLQSRGARLGGRDRLASRREDARRAGRAIRGDRRHPRRCSRTRAPVAGAPLVLRGAPGIGKTALLEEGGAPGASGVCASSRRRGVESESRLAVRGARPTCCGPCSPGSTRDPRRRSGPRCGRPSPWAPRRPPTASPPTPPP